jgi:hypothetical protein
MSYQVRGSGGGLRWVEEEVDILMQGSRDAAFSRWVRSHFVLRVSVL